eukprot:3596714-Amphidinium_carterae.1
MESDTPACVADEFRSDRDVVLAAVTILVLWSMLSRASEMIVKSLSHVSAAGQGDPVGLALDHASEKIKSDLKQDAGVFTRVEFRSDREVVQPAVEQNGPILQHAAENRKTITLQEMSTPCAAGGSAWLTMAPRWSSGTARIGCQKVQAWNTGLESSHMASSLTSSASCNDRLVRR